MGVEGWLRKDSQTRQMCSPGETRAGCFISAQPVPRVSSTLSWFRSVNLNFQP